MSEEGWPERLHRPTRSPDPFRAVPAILLTPIRQVPLRYLEVCADRFGHFPGQHPLYRRKLELPGENTSFTCGHPGSSLLFSIVSVSHFWGALQALRQLSVPGQPPGLPGTCLRGNAGRALSRGRRGIECDREA